MRRRAHTYARLFYFGTRVDDTSSSFDDGLRNTRAILQDLNVESHDRNQKSFVNVQWLNLEPALGR